MPEMPEVQAHAERLTDDFAGLELAKFQALKFTALRTAVPLPEAAYGHPLVRVGRRGKYLLLEFAPVTFAVHLMQGGRLLVDAKKSPKARGGQARFVFAGDVPALLLTEQGTERRAGVWALDPPTALTTPPLDTLGPEAAGITADVLLERFAVKNQRVHGFLRDQRMLAGLGRRLANEICHTAKLSPFAMTGSLGAEGAAKVAAAIDTCIAEGLAYERTRTDMSASKDRPAAVHARTGEACRVCGDTVRAVEYVGYTVNYCPTCQTNGKVLADNTTSKFLR
ncbi:MAG TPA: DNA-formamidopyrimidine glycosylase family protein [Ilumatobacter sp.]|nr:DNA-formamidopyrimidine glycosylase family protein [Ilumatobacter sp.]